MTGWAVDTAVAISLLILLVLLLRQPVARLFGARAAYALWAAPLVRAVLPPIPAAAVPVATPPMFNPANLQFVIGQSEVPSPHWPSLVLAVCIAGAAALLATQLLRHHRFVARALRDGRPLLLEGVDYDVIASGAVDGPMATGLIHPLILVPTDFAERFNPEQQRLALLHEQLHHRRGDIWASGAALIVTALLWFNPFAHMALRAFRRDMEAACDASLLSATGASTAPAYAETILRSAAHPVPRSLCALTAIDELKGRLMMLKLDHGRRRRLAGLIVAGTVVTAGVALAAPASSEKVVKEIKEVKITRTLSGHKPAGAGEAEALRNCPGEKIEVSAKNGSSSGRKEDTAIVLCGQKGASHKQMAETVDKAVARLKSDNEIRPEAKAQLITQLQAKAQELRAH